MIAAHQNKQADHPTLRSSWAPWQEWGLVQAVRVRIQKSDPLQGTFTINDQFVWNCCAKTHHVRSSLCSSIVSNSEVLVTKLSSSLFVWKHIPYSSYFYYPLFSLMLCYLSCSLAFLFRLVYSNHNYNIWEVKCKLTGLLKLLFLIKNTQ